MCCMIKYFQHNITSLGAWVDKIMLWHNPSQFYWCCWSFEVQFSLSRSLTSWVWSSVTGKSRQWGRYRRGGTDFSWDKSVEMINTGKIEGIGGWPLTRMYIALLIKKWFTWDICTLCYWREWQTFLKILVGFHKAHKARFFGVKSFVHIPNFNV